MSTDLPNNRSDEIPTTIRLSADLRAAIERAAEREHRTLSGQIRFFIATAIETQAGKQPVRA